MGSPAHSVGVAIGIAFLSAWAVRLRAEGTVTVKTPKGSLSVNGFAKVAIASRVRLETKAALVAVSAVVAGTA
jgi:hypothetical protein